MMGVGLGGFFMEIGGVREDGLEMVCLGFMLVLVV